MNGFARIALLHRRALGETQDQYGQRFGFTTGAAVSLWESGKREVPQKVLDAINNGELPQPKYKICDECGGTGVVAQLTSPKEQN